MFLLLCSLMMISNNTAMAWQMATVSHAAGVTASSQHTQHASNTAQMGKHNALDIVPSVDHATKAQHKSCVAQSCCFCLNYQPALQSQRSVSIEHSQLVSKPLHQQPLAGHFNNLDRPPRLNT